MLGVGVSLRHLRGTTAIDAYKVAGFSPQLVLDYENSKFRVSGSTSTAPSVVTATRTGLATQLDASGNLVWNAHNLALNSATPATQSITVVSGADYTVECTGSGSITLSGAGTGSVTEGNPVEITASTTTLTLTVVGSLDTMWAYRSDLGGMAPVPLTRRVAGSTTYVPTTSAAVYLPREEAYTYVSGSLVGPYYQKESASATNLLLNSDSLESQTVQLTPGDDYTLSFASGNSVVGIDASIADTAVDVFVYDTSKDSDGGAWRTGALAQASSWYNETLNTATRGSRREFPAVAVIVGESTKLTIYDGDDPSLPMWMVFNLSSGNALWRNPDAIVMGNGKLVTGSISGGYGVSRIDFLSEKCVAYATSNYILNGGLPIAQRNAGAGYALVFDGQAIVNAFVNDVAMTVLPDAPVDPATGLPVPTIAVATNGGVSVIKDDGTVSSSSGGYPVTSVVFSADGLRLAQSLNTATWDTIVSTDYLSSGFAGSNADGDYSQSSSSWAKDLLIGNTTDNAHCLAYGDDYTLSLGFNGGNKLGLFNIAEKAGNTSNGLLNYTTSSYNTGWMNGDIKGAFLADTDDTDLVGSGELVTNGTFDTDTSGWTPFNLATLSVVSGKLRTTNSVFSSGGAGQAITTVVGQRYVLRVELTGSNGFLHIGTSIGSTSILGRTLTTDEVVVVDFVATATTTWVTVSNNNAASGVFKEWDNISVKLADADRSVNNKGLIVNGTVTRSPVATGAELVAYSGWSVSNYLFQPYNSGLAVGTGDFCALVWYNANSLSGTTRWLVDQGSTGFGFAISTPTFFYNLAGNQVQYTYASTGAWNCAVMVRRNGVLYAYMNGEQVGTTSATGSVTATSGTFIGARSNLDPIRVPDARLALLRISATAPTAEQILKIYNDEKVLFQDNAACTLYGASDAVTALAHDPDTDLLHVGTSAGRSVFYRLRRINNTTTPVTTAISAANGIIGEQ